MIPIPKRLHKNLVAPYGEGELPSSLCSRTAYMCGRAVTDFCLEMGTRFIDVVMGRKSAITKIANLCGMDPDHLLKHAPVRVDTHNFEWNGNIIHQFGLNRYSKRICLRCINEDLAHGSGPEAVRPYMRSEWTLGGIRTCEKHNIALTDLAVSRSGIHVHDVPKLFFEQSSGIDLLRQDVIEQPYSEFERFLSGRLSGAPDLDNWLTDVRVDAAARICEMVGVADAEGASGRTRKLDERQLYRYAERGFQHIRGDPELTAFSERLVADCLKNRHYPSGLKVFGFIWSRYHVRSRDNGFDPFYNRLRNASINLLPVGPGDNFFGEVNGPRRWHTPRSLRAQFDFTAKQTVQTLMAFDPRPVWRNIQKNKHLFVDSAAIESFIARTRTALSTDEAMAFINAKPRWAKALVTNGFIKPLVSPDAFSQRAYLFEKETLTNFLGTILQDALPVESKEERFESIDVVANQIKTPWVTIIRLLAERRIRNVRRLETVLGCGGILLNPDDVLSALNRNSFEGFTVKEASKILSVTATSVRALIQHGLLESSKRLTRTRNLVRDLITEEDLNAFQRKYISTGEVAKRSGIGTNAVMTKCARQKIQPAIELPGASSRFYLRSQIPWN